MSEPKLISPMLDNFMVGAPISEHHGICCCPAMENVTDNRYIVKIISVPATPTQMDALLLSGAFQDEASAMAYFKDIADGVIQEVDILKKLSELEGFLSYESCQMEPMESGKGYQIYLLGSYKRTLEKHFKRHSMTHLDALNLGLDLCAALSVCRRMGYLYADLKPSNVFVADQRVYRIGDLGFISLDSLQYASLPEKYLSVYTPPEITDAFSALNSTMDIYAAGLILYQAYNNGELPFNSEVSAGNTLPSPLYADYEMSEIILKACSPDPQQRWQDPMQMGQAIVSYMQRNGANDTPIVPMPAPEPEQTQDADALQESDETPTEETNALQETEIAAEETDTPIDEDPIADSELLELTISPDTFDEDGSEKDDDPTDYENISFEVSEMLDQADELAAHSVPDPVVVPDHVDIPMPEPLEEEEESAEDEVQAETEVPDEEPQFLPEDDVEDDLQTPKKRKKSHWVRNTILILLLLALLTGGYYFYTNYYLLPIASITVEGSEDSLTVLIDTDVDESLLRVICSDAYGNQIPADVINGKAEFTGLVSNTAYNIKVVANGFHKLTGDLTTAYSTPVQSNIVQFDAVNGISDGSVILSFAVEGPDCDLWTVVYSSEGEEERSATFNSHMVTLTGLTLDKEYTFRLVAQDDLYTTGQEEIQFTVRKLVNAENLEIVSCANNALTATWTVPEGATVSGWSVRCYNDTYNQTIITTETTVTFQDLDHTAGYTVEVKAAGMSTSQTASIPANSVTAANFQVDTATPGSLTFTWKPSMLVSSDSCVLRYSITGIEGDVLVPCQNNSAIISPCIPNATYHVQVEDTSGNVFLSSQTDVSTGSPENVYLEFNGFTVSRDELSFRMCKRPSYQNWDRYDLSDGDYKTEFTVGEAASFLVYFNKRYTATSEGVTTLFVIRDQDDKPTHTAVVNSTWVNMWYKNYCELDIPVMPTAAGQYTMEVYFNNGLAAQQQFTITQ